MLAPCLCRHQTPGMCQCWRQRKRSSPINAPHTIHQGIEFAAGVDLLRDVSGPGAGDAVTLTQIWTLNNFFFVSDRDFGNNQIAGAPPNVLRTVLAYRRPDGLHMAPSLDWVPVGAYADYANTVRTRRVMRSWACRRASQCPLGSFRQAIVPMRFRFTSTLTDQRYIADLQPLVNASAPDPNPSIYFPGIGRAIYGGVKVTF
jgi:iron complex outermembrane recepter protein